MFVNFLNMKRVNTRGIDLANKHVLMAALTYNLKKYLKFAGRKAASTAVDLQVEIKTAFSVCFFLFSAHFPVVAAYISGERKS